MADTPKRPRKPAPDLPDAVEAPAGEPKKRAPRATSGQAKIPVREETAAGAAAGLDQADAGASVAVLERTDAAVADVSANAGSATASQSRRAKLRLIIHAGIHRTGTTAVQDALSDCRAQLASRGIAYPIDFTAANKPSASVNHLSLAWALKRNQVAPDKVKSWILDTTPPECGTVILSAEDFCTLEDVTFLNSLAEIANIEVVFYLRRQDEWINSWYNQHIRWPFDEVLSNTTPLQFLDHLHRFHWLRYFDVLERWGEAVGRENVRVRVLEPGQVSDVVGDFFELCGAERPAKEYRRNESSRAEHLELLRRLRLWRYPPSARLAIHNTLDAMPGDRSTNVYPAAIRKMLAQRYGMQNLRVARNYLNRKDGVLFRDTTYPNDIPCIDGTRPLDEALLLRFIEKLLSAKPRG
jgi:hypothetical protein